MGLRGGVMENFKLALLFIREVLVFMAIASTALTVIILIKVIIATERKVKNGRTAIKSVFLKHWTRADKKRVP